MSEKNGKWPSVPLGEVLQLCLDSSPTISQPSFNIAGIYSFGRGLFKRGPLDASQTTYKTFNCLHAGDFVISQPKAWEGAVALVTDEFEGWFLSPVFPTFRPVAERLDSRFLDWYFKLPRTWREMRIRSKGTVERRDSISPKLFLTIEIPLPSLEEQRRIVVRLDALAAKIEAARGLRSEIEAEAAALWRSGAESLVQSFDSACFRPLSSVVSVRGGGTPSKENPTFWTGNIPWVSPKDMKVRVIEDA